MSQFLAELIGTAILVLFFAFTVVILILAGAAIANQLKTDKVK